jgi:hypothetical protein
MCVKKSLSIQVSCANMRSAAALDGCTRTTRRMACFQAGYKYVYRARARRETRSLSDLHSAGRASIEQFFFFYIVRCNTNVLSYAKCSQCTTREYGTSYARSIY